MRIDRIVNGNIKIEILEPELFEFEIQFYRLQVICKLDPFAATIIQYYTNQLCEARQVFDGFVCLSFHDKGLHAVQAVKDEVGIHLRPKCFHFHFGYQLVDLRLSFLLLLLLLLLFPFLFLISS